MNCIVQHVLVLASVTAICWQASVSVAADPGVLVHRWQLNSQHVSGQEIAPLVGDHTASIVGPVKFSAENPQALVFSGDSKAGHRVSVTDKLEATKLPQQAISVDAWVKVGKPMKWGGLVGAIQDNGSYEKGWLLGFRDSQFCFAVATKAGGKLTYLTSDRQFEIDGWYHVVGTYDGRIQRLYVDGQLQAESTEQTGTIEYAPKAHFTIGAYHDDDELYSFVGEIEQISIWDGALDEQSIQREFRAHKSRFPGIDAVRPDVADWPTYQRDNQRTGATDEELKFPLQLLWTHRPRLAPQPAWPAPAQQDFWHKKFNLKARVIYDRAFHVAVVGERVFFGSSADDQVYCLDAKSGKILWSFFTEGPVRLAPTIADDRVLFGSDDGCVYCLRADDGQLIWKQRLVATDRRIPGNRRVISAWPVRTGVLVEEQVAYFCAGLFPAQGVFQAAVDLQTGKKLADGQVNISAQGYLERRSSQLYAATGRDPAGAFVAELSRRGKGVGKEIRKIPADYPYAFISAGNARLGGGDGKVAAFHAQDGAPLWSGSVDGKALGMAVARGNLYVSTDTGAIHCFGNQAATANSNSEKPAAQNIAATPIPNVPTPNASSKAAAIHAAILLEHANLRRGYCLVIGSGDGALAGEIARQSNLQVIGLESDDKLVAKSRRNLVNAGLYGQIVIHQWNRAEKLPYTDYLFNLIVDGRLSGDRTVGGMADDISRVLRPHGGKLVYGVFEDEIVERGPLAGVGEWTHLYANAANTVCSDDQLVGGQMALQWFGPPGPAKMLDRHHRTTAPLWKAGRLFIPGNDRIYAVDAYNGTVLWQAEIPNSRRIGIYRDCNSMVATDEVLYIAAADGCHVLDAETGEERELILPPSVANGEKREWGYLAGTGGLLFGTATKPGASRRGHNLAAINEGSYWDSRPLICSESVFAIDEASGEQQWSYEPPDGVIANPTIGVGDKAVYFVESTNPETKSAANGRVTPRDLFSQGAKLTALDRNSGSVLWSVPFDLSKIQHNAYVSYSAGKVIVVGSRNSGTDKKTSQVLYDIAVVNAQNGELMWKTTQNQGTKINGDHGEQDHHPIIVGDRLYCEPFAYELNTGRELADWSWEKKHRRGCGNISASANAFFFRNHNPTMFDLAKNEYRKVTTSTRPGCWINMIPAGGLLLIPEASSGCTCDFAVQTSLAFLPIRSE